MISRPRMATSGPDASAQVQPAPSRNDQGSLLIITLILTVVLASVVVAVTSYAAVGLRMSQVTDGRMARLAAAEAGIWWGAEQLVGGESCPGLSERAQEPGLLLNGEHVEVDCGPAYGSHIPPDVAGSEVYILSASLLMHGNATTVRATIQVPTQAEHLGTYRVLRFSISG